jgi:DNA-binding response OmpR family regulator
VLEKVDGTEVALARTLEEGRSLIRGGEPFDLVVLDLALPDGEGTELVPELRKRYPETPVAVLSARDDVEEAASKAGADAAIPKETPLPEIIAFFRRLAG